MNGFVNVKLQMCLGAFRGDLNTVLSCVTEFLSFVDEARKIVEVVMQFVHRVISL